LKGTAGDYWVGATQFDPSTPYGVNGEFGGTSAEFNEQFMKYFNGRTPDPYAAVSLIKSSHINVLLKITIIV
jgi:hypothetical protein